MMTTNVTQVPSQTPRLLRIGDLSRLTGKTVRAIHLYEELGLLQPVSRTSGGFRLYEPSAVERVRWIELFHGMGFSLQEMRELVHAWWDAGLGPEAMDTLRSLFKRKLEDTREAVLRSQQLERELAAGLSYLEACRVCAAPASTAKGCVGCQQDHGMERAPALVAGLKSASPGRSPRRSHPVYVSVEEIQ
jgi:MerR family transcriptional regulator, copper efflux regulator